MTDYFVPPNIFTKIKEMLVRKQAGEIRLEFDGSGRISGAWVTVYVPAEAPAVGFTAKTDAAQ